MPAPPRSTNLSLNSPPMNRCFPKKVAGLQAKPSCGPKLFRSLFVSCLEVEIFAPAKPPAESRIKLPKTRPPVAVTGEKYSHRNPRLNVTLGRNFQSSWAKNAISLVRKGTSLAIGFPSGLAVYCSKIGVPLAKFHGRKNEYSGLAPPNSPL